MRTIRTKIYKYSELTEQGKASAIENYRNSGYDNQFYYDEIIESVKAVAELLNFKFGREYTDIRTGNIDDNILQLSGVRLYKYLVNNYYSDLFKPSYIKIIHRSVYWKQFICERGKGQNGEYTQIYSRMRISKDNCPLTGVCYDADILAPIYDFMAKIGTSTTFEDLINDISNAISKCFESTENWLNSKEFITSEFEANNYEFTQDGRIF